MESHEEDKPRRARKRWGEETSAGQQVLQEAQRESPAPDGPDNQPGGPGAEPSAKKRKSRWEALDESKLAVQAPPIALPSSIAHLINFDPESLELNRQLNIVSIKLYCILYAWFGSYRSSFIG